MSTESENALRSESSQQTDGMQTSHAQHAYTRHISVIGAVRKRKNHQSNLWIFDSPKINRRFVIEGDVAFMHFVLLEGDVDIKSYDPDPAPITTLIDGETRQTKLDAIIYRRNGQVEWLEFKRSPDAGPNRRGRARSQLSAQAQAASLAGIPYRVLTELDLVGKEIRFDNWLLLCSAITRVRAQTLFRETRILEKRLETHHGIAVGALLDDPEVDPALMLAVIAKALQANIISTDLDSQFLGRLSIISGGQQ